MPKENDPLPPAGFDRLAFARQMAGTVQMAEAIKRGLTKSESRRAIQLGLPPAAAAPGIGARQLLMAGASAAEKVANDRRLDVSDEERGALSDLERIGLESLIRLTDRPALFVLGDTLVDTPPPRWKELQTVFLENIEGRLPRVGRISTGSGANKSGWGTGFVVAPDVIVTNRHVLQQLGDPDPGPPAPAPGAAADSIWRKWRLAQENNPTIDFKVERDSEEMREFRITGVLGATLEDENRLADIAFLRVERESADSARRPLPEPVVLSADPPEENWNKQLYAIGYPMADNEALPGDPALREQVDTAMKEIFGEVYGVKRLQPGLAKVIIDDQKVFSHDCSTLGGNSGSCVVELDSNRVIGLHFQGVRMRSNWAVAWWLYRDDPFLTGKVGVRFG